MATQVTLVAGDVTDEAQTWLKAHGAKIEGFGLLTITLPASARVSGRDWAYTVQFFDAQGNDELSYLSIELNIDAYETSIELEYDADRQCSCKGRGCAECIAELAAIERGENPYAHHLQAA
jgi:hypothetical protein